MPPFSLVKSRDQTSAALAPITGAAWCRLILKKKRDDKNLPETRSKKMTPQFLISNAFQSTMDNSSIF